MDSIQSDFHFTCKELKQRIAVLQRAISDQGLDGAMILQRVDLLYYTAASFQGTLLVPATGDAKLIVWKGWGRIGENCPVEVVQIHGMGKFSETVRNSGLTTWKKIGIEEDVVPVGILKRLGMPTWESGEFHDISPAIRAQRSVKSEKECEAIRISGGILSAGFRALPGIIKIGMPEYEVQARMELLMRTLGDQALPRTRAFNAEAIGVIACGPSIGVSAVFDGPLPQPGRYPLAVSGSGNGLMQLNLPIIADTTSGFYGYMTDMARTFYFGKLEARFKEAHQFCVELNEELMRRMIPGAIPEELYLWAVEEAEKVKWGKNFMNRGDDQVRFIGHGIGFEMDELPVLARRFTEPLEENMVIAIEPKVVFDDGAVGVEDTVIVKPGGAVSVTVMDRGLRQLE